MYNLAIMKVVLFMFLFRCEEAQPEMECRTFRPRLFALCMTLDRRTTVVDCFLAFSPTLTESFFLVLRLVETGGVLEGISGASDFRAKVETDSDLAPGWMSCSGCSYMGIEVNRLELNNVSCVGLRKETMQYLSRSCMARRPSGTPPAVIGMPLLYGVLTTAEDRRDEDAIVEASVPAVAYV